jgi:hypothetical protein
VPGTPDIRDQRVTDIRKALDKAGTARTVVLPPDIYEVPDTLRFRGRVIIGDPYHPERVVFKILPRAERYSPAVIMRGVNPRIHGITFVGSAPDGRGYDEDREAQHAIEWEGAESPEVGRCVFRNLWGDCIYHNKSDDGSWSHNGYMHDLLCDEIGRHFVTPNASEHSRLTRCVVGRVGRAIVDIEPDGDTWGAHYFTWSDTDIYDTGGSTTFANKGAGLSDSVHHITLDGIRCHNSQFSAIVNPIPKPGRAVHSIRRHDFTFTGCGGAGHAQAPAVTLHDVDRAAIVAMNQKMGPGDPLVWQDDCTDVVTSPS